MRGFAARYEGVGNAMYRPAFIVAAFVQQRRVRVFSRMTSMLLRKPELT
jgi:hypothetical protein